jgi:hypothetical protein
VVKVVLLLCVAVRFRVAAFNCHPVAIVTLVARFYQSLLALHWIISLGIILLARIVITKTTRQVLKAATSTFPWTFSSKLNKHRQHHHHHPPTRSSNK